MMAADDDKNYAGTQVPEPLIVLIISQILTFIVALIFAHISLNLSRVGAKSNISDP